MIKLCDLILDTIINIISILLVLLLSISNYKRRPKP